MTIRFSNFAALVLAALPIIAIAGIVQMETAARAVGF